MAAVIYVATVKESRLLELPRQAEALGLRPGDKVSVHIDQNNDDETVVFPVNQNGLAAMRTIAERQQNRPAMEGSDIVKLVREARAGGMFGNDLVE